MVKESLRQNYSAMVKHSTTGFPFSVRVLYFDEFKMYKTVKINTTQAVNITVRPHTLRPQPPPAFVVAVFGMVSLQPVGIPISLCYI